MAEDLSIRDRIELEAKRRLEAIANAPDPVERWDHRGRNSTAHRSAVIYPGPETPEADAIGEEPSLTLRFRLVVLMLIAQAEDDPDATAQVIAREVAAINQALTDEADPHWIEPATGDALITEIIYAGADEPALLVADGIQAIEQGVNFDITYDVLRGDPYRSSYANLRTV